jgi:NHLM bacteriocin system ABC transporter ATP-binding protein
MLVGAPPEKILPGKNLRIDSSEAVWWVAEGHVDLHLEFLQQGRVVWREHLFAISAGGALFALPKTTNLRVVAASRGQAILQPVDLATLRDLGSLSEAAETWIEKLSAAFAARRPVVDFVDATLPPGGELDLLEGQRVAAEEGVVWAILEGGKAAFFDEVELDASNAPLVLPLTPKLWLSTRSPLHLSVLPPGATAPTDSRRLWMIRFHRLVMDLLVAHLEEAWQRERERLSARDRLELGARRSILARFSQVIDPGGERSTELSPSPLLAACQRLGDALGVEVEPPPYGARVAATEGAQIEEISRRARLRARRVVLRDGWWRRETRPMLAFWRDRGEPLVLLPGKKGCVYWTPRANGEAEETKTPGLDSTAADTRPQTVDESIAHQIDPVAWSFYRTLPDRPLGLFDLLGFAASRCHHDLGLAALCGALVATMGLLVPLATGLLVDIAIPSNQVSYLLLGALGMAIAALATFSFQFAQDIAILRIQGKVSEALQPALLDRLLRLPNTFFRHYSAGDLAERVKTVDDIESRLAEGLFSTVLTGVMSSLNFLVMFYLAPSAALLAMALFVLMSLSLAFFANRQTGYWLGIHRLEGQLASFVLQMTHGIHRIRVAAGEDRVFVRWGHLSMKFRDLLTRCYNAEVRFSTWLKGYQILSLAAVFGILALSNQGHPDRLSTGGFLAFIVAFTASMGGFAAMAKTVLASIELVPMYRRLAPLLKAIPESDALKTHPGVLSGRIEITELTFRYSDATADILQGISFEIEPGENVALVGPSGCGKSSLFRLILGFERPTSGSIYFDGKDLAGLDLREVRHQIGVVLQHDELMEGTLFENIRGDNNIATDDAWQAARQSSLAPDIEAMPLGMHTVVSASGSELSGGQFQRLLLARALAAKPRILLLDEATSALDNRSQAEVTKSLDHLRVTRLAIAHRLSTVRNADRILVMDQGQIVESGSYEDLIARGGFFAELVQRQIH